MGQPREGPVQALQPVEQDSDRRLQGSTLRGHDPLLEYSLEMQITKLLKKEVTIMNN